MSDTISEYVGGLPDASGTFTGTFDLDSPIAEMFAAPALISIEIDTYDQPNSAADMLPGQLLAIRAGDKAYSFLVDHVEPLGGNVVRVWCKLPQVHSVE